MFLVAAATGRTLLQVGAMRMIEVQAWMQMIKRHGMPSQVESVPLLAELIATLWNVNTVAPEGQQKIPFTKKDFLPRLAGETWLEKKARADDAVVGSAIIRGQIKKNHGRQ